MLFPRKLLSLKHNLPLFATYIFVPEYFLEFLSIKFYYKLPFSKLESMALHFLPVFQCFYWPVINAGSSHKKSVLIGVEYRNFRRTAFREQGEKETNYCIITAHSYLHSVSEFSTLVGMKFVYISS